MEHMKWLEAITAGDSAREIGRHADVSFRTVANQINRHQFSAEVVIKIAEGYSKSPVRALVDTGYLDEEWAKTVDPETAIWSLSEEAIANHVLERMKLPGTHKVFQTPVDELAERRNTPGGTANDQSEQSETPPSVHDDDDDDGTVRPFDWEPGTYAADSSPDEDAGREEEGADPFP
ncbi:hypothetical protein [Corynebacterium glyciniphilum]|uniref:hypothetical protein n=1 Tax=Corynebacterium glyciniphilum TaxID=1404244 RepID=UPI00265233B6|nr:hypothetical protein [Corynebacterium glyciniphilum]MDN6707352.1 hypothetical protein [Corynebacterium glyciniphilum]